MDLGVVLQVVLAVVLVVALGVLGFFVYNREFTDSIRASGLTRSQVTVLDGIRDFYLTHDEFFVSDNKASARYLDLPLAQNQAGGAEFTYNWWLYKDPSAITDATVPSAGTAGFTTDAGLDPSDFVLFVRGDKTVHSFANVCGAVDTTVPRTPKTDVLVKCPLVKLQSYEGKKMDVLAIEFNTDSHPEAVHESPINECGPAKSTDWLKKNSYKIGVAGLSGDKFSSKWCMFTLILQDTLPSDPLPFRNKIHVRLYVNGMLELDRYIDSAVEPLDDSPSILRQNNGHLFVGPTISMLNASGGAANTFVPTAEEKLMMADLKYCNYAVDVDTIRTWFEKGFKKTTAPSVRKEPDEYPMGDRPVARQLDAF